MATDDDDDDDDDEGKDEKRNSFIAGRDIPPRTQGTGVWPHLVVQVPWMPEHDNDIPSCSARHRHIMSWPAGPGAGTGLSAESVAVKCQTHKSRQERLANDRRARGASLQSQRRGSRSPPRPRWRCRAVK
eukprot:8437906-Pyramimonas_sp.AAC.1